MTEIRRRIRASQAQEKRGARVMGGAVRPGSGSKPSAKGDVRVPRAPGVPLQECGVLIEYKRTDSRSFSLKISELEKIRGEALLEGRRHLMGIELGGRHYVVLEEHDYTALLEAAQGDDDGLHRGQVSRG
jgi:hypothetical protein